MTTFDSAITRAETDLAHAQSALETAQQVIQVADRAHRFGRRLISIIRIVAIALAFGGAVVGVVVLFDRLSRRFHREHGHETTSATGSSPLPETSSVQVPPDETAGRFG